VIFAEATLEGVAKDFSMHPRTLNRRLQAEGASFRDLLNQARLTWRAACSSAREWGSPISHSYSAMPIPALLPTPFSVGPVLHPVNGAEAAAAHSSRLRHHMQLHASLFVDREPGWWPLRATADKRAAVDAVEERLRTFQAFLMSLSGKGILNARSALPIVGAIETAVKNHDALALQAAVREAFASEQYVRWSLIAAEAAAAAVAISTQFTV
jgi:hypothetical protein